MVCEDLCNPEVQPLPPAEFEIFFKLDLGGAHGSVFGKDAWAGRLRQCFALSQRVVACGR